VRSWFISCAATTSVIAHVQRHPCTTEPFVGVPSCLACREHRSRPGWCTPAVGPRYGSHWVEWPINQLSPKVAHTDSPWPSR
jgi:hypothetical protein